MTYGIDYSSNYGITYSEDTGAPATTTLTLALADSADPVISGANFNYTAVLTNTGAIDATTVSVVITLDAAVTFVSGSGTGWAVNHAAGVVTCTRGTLAPGAAPTITITVTSSNTSGTLSTSGVGNAANAAAAANDTEVTNIVQFDGPGAYYVPKTAAEWTALGLTAPQHLYGFQETSGNILDLIAGAAPMVPGGAASDFPDYRQTVSGWARKGCTFDPAVSNQGFSVAAGSGPNLGTQSFAMIGYFNINNTGTATAHHIMGAGIADPDTQNVAIYTTTTGNDLFGFRSENTTVVASAYDIEPSTLAIMLVFNRGAGTSKVYYSILSSGTPGEILSATYVGAIADGYKIFGTVPVSAASAYTVDGSILWGAMWSGAAAEFTDATVTTLFGALNVPKRFAVPFDGPAPYINFPTSTAHFATLGITEPLSVWGFQESSGNLPALGGTAGFTLTAAVTPNYSQAITNYVRKGILYDANSGDAHMAAAGVGPNPATTSVLWMGFIVIGGATTNTARCIMTAGGATAANEMTFQTKDVGGAPATVAVKCRGVTAVGALDVETGAILAPFALQYDRTNSAAILYTLNEKIVVTYDAGVTDGPKGFGYNFFCQISKPGYGCVWSGANAEITPTQVKALMTSFGWAPTFTP